MNNKINLVEILKHYPKGRTLYSTTYGPVSFDKIDEQNGKYPIVVTLADGARSTYTKYGQLHADYIDGECVLFPTKNQRDWSKFNVPKEDLPKGTIVLCKIGGHYILRAYAQKGFCYNYVDYDEHRTDAFQTIIPLYYIKDNAFTIDKRDIDNIIVTDEINYGRSYWRQFDK